MHGLGPELVTHLGNFFQGTSCELKPWLESRLRQTTCTFFLQMHAVDLESMQRFFDYGPRRNRALKEHHALTDGLILQEQLDDLLVTDLWQSLRPQLYPAAPLVLEGETALPAS